MLNPDFTVLSFSYVNCCLYEYKVTKLIKIIQFEIDLNGSLFHQYNSNIFSSASTVNLIRFLILLLVPVC